MIYKTLGPKGTFSEKALLELAPKDVQIIYESSIEHVLKQMDGFYACVPIENTLEGYIQQTLDGIYKEKLYIIDSVSLYVDFTLVGHIKNMSEIKRVYVQFATKNQCLNFFNDFPNVKVILTHNNVESLSYLDSHQTGDAAIIPSHLKAQFKGFRKDGLADQLDNQTRFVLLSKKPQFKKAHAYRLSCVITPTEDRPGLLVDLLNVFKKEQINLTSIMSRPTKKLMGTYHFFMEMDVSDFDLKKTNETLEGLKSSFEVFIFGLIPLM